MNPSSRAKASALAHAVVAASSRTSHTTVIAAPDIFIPEVRQVLGRKKKVLMGAQNIAPTQDVRALTGETGADMLQEYGVTYVIVGHSERRYVLQEDETLIAKKILLAQQHNIIPILCVGEKSKMSLARAKKVVIRQLFSGLSRVKKGASVVIAYEPVWAIGGDKDPQPAHNAAMAKEIHSWLKRRISGNTSLLYGGSVRCNNMGTVLEAGEYDGVLVGSAGLHEKEVSCIMKAS